MSKVKLFDLNRLARFENLESKEPVYFVPGDISAIVPVWNHTHNVPTGRINVYLDGGTNFTLFTTLEQLEAEINRALAATSSAAHEYADESAKEIADKLVQLKATIKDADMMANNDFYPDLDKDKKGYN